jgi:hypothetical protein
VCSHNVGVLWEFPDSVHLEKQKTEIQNLRINEVSSTILPLKDGEQLRRLC